MLTRIFNCTRLCLAWYRCCHFFLEKNACWSL